MKKVAIINGGKYLGYIKNTLRNRDYEITEWDIIPIVGGYDIVLIFLEDILVNMGDLLTLRSVKKAFLDYVFENPCRWIMIAPQDNKRIRKRGLMKNHYRAIFDACKFGYLFRKRFRLWSSFPMDSVLCNKACSANMVRTRNTRLHDPENWHLATEKHERDRITLMKRYDEINQIPEKLITYVFQKIDQHDIDEYGADWE